MNKDMLYLHSLPGQVILNLQGFLNLQYLKTTTALHPNDKMVGWVLVMGIWLLSNRTMGILSGDHIEQV